MVAGSHNKNKAHAGLLYNISFDLIKKLIGHQILIELARIRYITADDDKKSIKVFPRTKNRLTYFLSLAKNPILIVYKMNIAKMKNSYFHKCAHCGLLVRCRSQEG